MSFQPSRTETIKTLFHGNRFVIPSYQRKYSWSFDQRKALWDDIVENLDMSHFIGTLCFQKNDGFDDDVINDTYDVIDGQQRITTLYILMNVLISYLESSKKEAYKELFIGTLEKPKLMPLGGDEEFMKKVIFDYKSINISNVAIRSQKQIYAAKRDFISLVENLEQNKVSQLIEYVSKEIEILIFNVKDQAQAVKMFTVINDRGLPLSNLDKTKSALMMYSTIYLDCELNDNINETFGKIFDLLDNVLYKKEQLQIFRTLDDTLFENTFFTHHYYSCRHLFSDWDYKLGAASIFKHIKRKCEQEKTNDDNLHNFILEYLRDFYLFSRSYSELFDKIYSNEQYAVLFQYMEFSATLFPLIVRLNQQGKLDGALKQLELAEIRVYKLKNTNPRRNMYLFASEINEHDTYSEKRINASLNEFVTNFLNDYQFENYLKEGIDSKIPMVRYVYFLYNREKNGQDLNLETYRNLQVEHIFSTSPNYDTSNYGFEIIEVYNENIRLLGNLTILERGLNSKVSNISPTDKVDGYQESKIQLNSQLMAKLSEFDSDMLKERNKKMIVFMKERFALDGSSSA